MKLAWTCFSPSNHSPPGHWHLVFGNVWDDFTTHIWKAYISALLQHTKIEMLHYVLKIGRKYAISFCDFRRFQVPLFLLLLKWIDKHFKTFVHVSIGKPSPDNVSIGHSSCGALNVIVLGSKNVTFDHFGKSVFTDSRFCLIWAQWPLQRGDQL